MKDNGSSEKTVFAPQTVSQRSVAVVEKRAANPTEGIQTGIARLDKVLNRHRRGELRIVLGYTSNYKTGLMNYIARHTARGLAGGDQRKVVITVTWEQSIEEQGLIDIAQLEAMDVTRMVRGEMEDADWRKLKSGAIKRGALPWWLIGHSSEDRERRPRMSMTDVARALEYIVDVQKVEPALIVLDYLQRIKREGGGEPRMQFMEIVDRAKDMSLAFAPVMLGSQAKREVKERKWQLPQTEDAQETSNLEQSADSLISVWMPKTSYPPGTELKYGKDTYTVDKNLLILGVMKQKYGEAPVIMPLHVKPEVNEIEPRYL
jgi:replicative DNA helicase